VAVYSALVLAAAVVLWGGYAQHWSWAGINGKTATLWDWLHLLMLPLAVAVLPLWLSRRTRLGRPHKLSAAGVVLVIAVVAVAGYTVPWGWTGFVGNKLWDWLELLALPLAVALIPAYPDLKANWGRRHTLMALVATGLLVVAALGGYLGDWSWTGFRGNTVWDWLHLLLLPLLIPVVIVPAFMPMASAGLTYVEEPQRDSEESRLARDEI
jgi:hypothetical protein